MNLSPEEQELVKAIREHFAVYRDQVRGRLRTPGLAALLGSPAAEKEKTMRLARAVAEPCQQLLEVNDRLLIESTARSTRLGAWFT